MDTLTIPIIFIEDDQDDKEIMTEIVNDLQIDHPLLFFDSTEQAMDFLAGSPEKPFIIFCDTNFPRKNGLALKKAIDQHPVLKGKSIPFILYSSIARQADIDLVYKELTVQGFFLKPITYNETRTIMKTIFDYWIVCKHPSK